MEIGAPQKASWSFVLDEPLRLLVVDDDPILREFACVYLSAPHVTIETAGDGEEGWARLATSDYDIALIDIEMPRLNGYDLVTRIRTDTRLHDLPVIMVTGREDAASIDRAFDVGASSFIVKPVNWRQLSHQVRYVVRSVKHEREARRARDKAISVSQMKSEILTLMRHEIRTPLNAIIGFSSLIEQQSLGPISDNGYVEHARYVRLAGENLLGLFNDLMLYSSLSAGDRDLREDEYEMETIATRIVSAVENKLGPVRSTLVFESGLKVVADRELLERAIFHIVINAVLHGGGLTRFSVTTAMDGSVTIQVCDQGPGLTDAQVAACMEPFHQQSAGLTRRKDGLGLGLPLAKLVAELHGGLLAITWDENGTSVSIKIPRSRVLIAKDELAA